jgi:hypothetical protein
LQAWFSEAADKLLGLYLPYGSIRTKAVFLADLYGDGDLDGLLARIFGAEISWNEEQGAFRRSEIHFEYREEFFREIRFLRSARLRLRTLNFALIDQGGKIIAVDAVHLFA